MTLASWIVLALVVIGVVLLGAAGASLLLKLGCLKRAADVAKGTAAEAQALQTELERLQTQVLQVQAKIESLRPVRLLPRAYPSDRRAGETYDEPVSDREVSSWVLSSPGISQYS